MGLALSGALEISNNVVSGNVSALAVAGDGISFGPVAATRRMCENVMDQENAFLQALESAHHHAISGESLEITDANGELVTRYVAVYLQ